MILDQIGELQTSEEALVKEMLQRPRIFDDENLRGFPQNRSQLEMIATQQIGTLEKIIELKEAQILKVNEILPCRWKSRSEILLIILLEALRKAWK
jgi:hypothetical protein